MAQVGIHPALNRFVAGFDMIANGVRVMINAAGPEDIAVLQQRTVAAFDETAKFEAAVATILASTGTTEEREAALVIIRARLPVKKI